MSKNKNQESMGEVFVISVAAELAGMHANGVGDPPTNQRGWPPLLP